MISGLHFSIVTVKMIEVIIHFLPPFTQHPIYSLPILRPPKAAMFLCCVEKWSNATNFVETCYMDQKKGLGKMMH